MSWWNFFDPPEEEPTFDLNEMPTPEFYEQPATDFGSQPKFKVINEEEINLNQVMYKFVK